MAMLLQRGSPTAADVFLVGLSGQIVRKLTSGPGIKAPVGASPDGRQFAYRVESPDGTKLPDSQLGIFIQDLATGSRWSLRERTGVWGHVATWSPDAAQIAFDGQTTVPGPAQLYVIDTDGSDLRLLSPDGVDDEYPAWSPTGDEIAFHRSGSGYFHLRLVRSDGSARRELTHGARVDEWPIWSPDGARLAFQSDNGISVLELTDGTPKLLIRADIGGVPASWAPADLIAFACLAGEWICVVDPGNPVPRVAVKGNFPIWIRSG
jgi:Tol biopolymer transport system component